MQPTNQAGYQARHPKTELIAAEFPDCAAALNALFNNTAWALDEALQTEIGDEVDLSDDDDLKRFSAGPKVTEERRLRWRAPVETFRGPCSLWKETHEVTPTQATLMAARRSSGLLVRLSGLVSESATDDVPPPPPPSPKFYTAYTLVCEVGKVLDEDFQVLTRIADRHNCAFGVEAMGDKVLLQLTVVR